MKNKSGKSKAGTVAGVQSDRERKSVDDALRKCLTRLAEYQRLAHIGSWEVNLETGTLTWSDELYRIYDVDPKTFLLNQASFLGLIHPEDRRNVEKWIAALLSHKKPPEITFRRTLSDGSIRYISGQGELQVNEEGRPFRAVGTAQDVTERKKMEAELLESEERFRATFKTAGIGIALVSLEGRWLSANPKLCSIVGYTEEELLKLNFRDITYAEDLESDVRVIQQLLNGEISSYTREKRYIHKNGFLVWINSTLAVVRGLFGEPEYFIKTVEDITDRKSAESERARLSGELEQKVRQRTSQLEAANKELEAFAYSVSHDLRAPLRSIDGFSQALLEDYADKLDDHGKSNLRRVRAASQRMAQLIDDLLQISRVTRVEMSLQRVNLSALAEEVADDLRKHDPARRVEFHIQPDLFADVDAPLIRIVFENLLGNAWKFTSKNPTARIEFGRIEKSGKTVFFVRDDGAGFDMQYADKLFGAFQRLHNAQEFPGTGIGLTSVQRILSRHGGKIWAEAEVEHGATFFFTLN